MDIIAEIAQERREQFPLRVGRQDERYAQVFEQIFHRPEANGLFPQPKLAQRGHGGRRRSWAREGAECAVVEGGLRSRFDSNGASPQASINGYKRV